MGFTHVIDFFTGIDEYPAVYFFKQIMRFGHCHKLVGRQYRIVRIRQWQAQIYLKEITAIMINVIYRLKQQLKAIIGNRIDQRFGQRMIITIGMFTGVI